MDFQLFSKCGLGNKVKISLNIVGNNSSMYINVVDVDGFVKAYSGPYRISWVETLTGIQMTLSSMRWGLEYDSGFLCLM